MNYNDLCKVAYEAKENAYSPYYKFRVGSAVLTKSGKVFSGCNIETGAGFSICAERVAVSKAISEGEKEFVAIAVATDTNSYVSPCGVCRQFLSEFNSDMQLDVLLFNGKDYKEFKLNELLPHSFKL